MYGTLLSSSSPPTIRTERFTDNLSALQALIAALNDLDTLCETIEDAYDTSLKNDEIERWDEKF